MTIDHSNQRLGRPLSPLCGADLVAHTPSTSTPEVWHSLGDHLRAVGDLAAAFAEPFGGASVARVMGYLHDAGKATAVVQDAFRARHVDKGRRLGVPHKEEGAAIVLRAGRSPVALACALAIMGHHGGMPDLSDATDLRYDATDAASSLEVLLAKVSDEVGVDVGALLDDLSMPAWITDIQDTNARNLEVELFVRMCFSALVDADFLDTAAHFADSQVACWCVPAISRDGRNLRGPAS